MNAKADEQKRNRKPNPPEELVIVHRTTGLPRAHVIKGKLESMGIHAMLKYESAGPVMGIAIDGMGEIQILVPKSRAKEAVEILKTD